MKDVNVITFSTDGAKTLSRNNRSVAFTDSKWSKQQCFRPWVTWLSGT